ncbi:MAG: dTMP kinase [Treponema sp.]|jgi:dTMP kinase|nr:dTMP kinase [Treponema sp.]MBQ1795193.1 dTMP kinase [Treponema sp.]MBQ2208130.1 dTMP kinase [Treponema sp.]MBQ2355276.1 dTMP kinase [Treponema sp.]MBQ5450318.1 dTMP kinase [Treponema sp.]
MILQNFIVFEGIDGAGTSTQIEMLKNRPEAKDFLFTAEPTSAPTGKFLRQMLKGDFPLQNESAAYLFAADRNEHVNGKLLTQGNTLVTGIKEACQSGRKVVSDRYLFSSLAYQSINCPPEVPRLLNSLFPLPQLLFYFEISPKDSLSRLGDRNFREIYEKEDFLNRTVQEYHNVLSEYSEKAKNQGMKIVLIDAKKTKEEISANIWQEIKNLPIV